MKTLLALCISAIILTFCEGFSILRRPDSVPWQPAEGSREEWLRCHGYPCEEWNKTIAKMREFQKMLLPAGFQPQSINETDDSLDTCIWLTGEQLDDLMERHRQQEEIPAIGGHERQKRKLKNFENNGFAMWPPRTRIQWKFDGMHDDEEKEKIRGAFSHWEAQTCMRFQEVSTNDYLFENHILITRQPTGCHSFIGRVHRVPQQLNLQSECVLQFGVAVHEIGHALGLWHEQQRIDRDDHVRILKENLGFYTGQFLKRPTVDLGVAYETGSVMHYNAFAGSKNGLPTMMPRNPLYMRNMGQRTGLSFNDAKIINKAYCEDRCHGDLPRPCERDGYRDPNHCDRCLCPDGFSGIYCEQVAPPAKADCGGRMVVGETRTIIQSPGYLDPHYYDNHQECNWHVIAPPGHQVSLEFVGDFGLYCYNGEQCHHWVEIKYESGLNKQGPRFCCYEKPNVILQSTGGEMMVVFRANWTQEYRSTRRGFRALVHAVADKDTADPTTPTTTTTSTTTTTTTTTTHTTTPTTTTPTTTGATLEGENGETKDGCDKLDLVFVLDSSGSVMISNWEKVLLYVKSLIVSLPEVGVQDTHLSLVTYGNQGMVHFDLAAYQRVYDVLSAVDRVPYKDQRTNTAAGLALARGVLAGPGHRSQARKVVVLLTDGKSDDNSGTLREAAILDEMQADVYVVGVGDNVDFEEVALIARQESRVIYANDFATLPSFDTLKKTYSLICNYTTTEVTSNVAWECDFDSSVNTLCGMAQVGSGNGEFDWSVGRGATPSQNTGPTSAVSGEQYIFIEATGRSQNDQARINFPVVVAGVYCVSFDYSMYGHHVRSLRLYLSRGGPEGEGANTHRVGLSPVSSSTSTYTIWRRTSDQGSAWKHTRIEVELQTGDKMVLEATRGGGYSGDIAVDTIRVTTGGCPL